MHTRIFILLLVILSALISFADKKKAIRNDDARESFEVSVPDGSKIQKYNINWLDSIPYLKEHARRGELWAYEALAECYRHGKGGVKRSVFTSVCYYNLAEMDEDMVIENIRRRNNEDPFVVVPRMIRYIRSEDYRSIKCAIDTLNRSGYHSAYILIELLNNADAELCKRKMTEVMEDKNTDTDVVFFAALGLGLIARADSTEFDLDWGLPIIMEKLPYFYSLVGTKKYRDTIKADDREGYAADTAIRDKEDRRKAVEYLIKADEYGFLTKDAAKYLYHYCTMDGSSFWVKLADEDIRRIGKIAGYLE